ncbi:MAG: hypothetical protein KKC75_00165 [Nanoarchaeota archaeon]|nr:hypothetical protein [Nanoarchaeota archaeon]MBU1004888.1 hypothetical protein [Nanoarchaeota archaeon]MBU1945401.1 hypothetical protein [Nanoarchaeota archaeon]
MILLQDILVRVLEILLVPYYHKEVLWTIAPLIFSLIMLQMYFGKYKTELLGWNTAFGNSISLVWVTTILLKYMSNNYGLKNVIEQSGHRVYLILILCFGVYTLSLTFINFNHLLPRRFAFWISSSLPVNVLAYFIIVIVMGRITIDETTLFAALILFLFFGLVFNLYRRSITPPKSEEVILKKHEEKRKKNISKIKKKLSKLPLLVFKFKDKEE